jgi:cob(I)alamin adenosyltransferase
MKYFTKKGDKGTSKIGNNQFKKNSLILETLGELDELNSLIGLAKNYLPKKYFQRLTEIQNDLFIIQANIAWFIYKKFNPPHLNGEKIKKMEREIKQIENKIKPQHKFVIPGQERNSAWFDYLRSVTRRIERKVVNFYDKLKNKNPQNKKEILAYLNRLSSYFYALARFECYNKKIKEKEVWYDYKVKN